MSVAKALSAAHTSQLKPAQLVWCRILRVKDAELRLCLGCVVSATGCVEGILGLCSVVSATGCVEGRLGLCSVCYRVCGGYTGAV